LRQEPATSGKRTIRAWCLYDFANSAFTTIVVSFVYSTYFAKGIVGDEDRGAELWSRAVAITGITVALLSPFLGALADRGGYRKRFLFVATAIAVAGSVGLFFPREGDVLLALSIFVVANIAYELGMVFYNAFLPTLGPPERIGRVSGFGWALGYVGGLLALVIALWGLVEGKPPWFGFSTEGSENIRATSLLVAVWFAVFSIPFFLFVREDRSRVRPRPAKVLRQTVAELVTTFHEVRRYRQIVRLLVARLLYNDGLVTVFFFGALYAQKVLGFTPTKLVQFGIVLNVAAGIGAFAFGYLDDRLGGRTTILVSLAALATGALLAIISKSEALFWVGGVIIGAFSGPNQAASRSLMGRFVPPKRENEFFGFFAFSGKATAFLGPWLYGILTSAVNQRAGMSVVIVFFVAGGLILLTVDEKDGVRAAGRSAEPQTTD
jgi:UMF1 family MFS transporter